MAGEKKNRNLLLILSGATLFPALLFSLFLFYPRINILQKGEEGQSLRIYDRNGVLLYETLSEEMTKTRWIAPNSIPPLVEGAAIASEDKRFYKHCGIDPFALIRALWIDLKSLSIKQGGSTITQQTAKLIMKRKGKNPFLKIFELFYAIKLETQLSKKEILSIYLNLAPYGKNIVGIKKAAEVYFNSPIENLTPAQIAYLSAIPKSPSYYDPSKNFNNAKKRQRNILKKMKELGYLSQEQYVNATNEKTSVERRPSPFIAPHFVERVIEEEKELTEKAVLTTIDARLMKIVSHIIDSKKELLEKIGAKNVAVAVLDNKSGEILAWEGSGKYFSDEEGSKIDGVVTPRQPGSALKPFLYALAFEQKKFFPSSPLPDIPSSFQTSKEGSYYTPKNYDNKFRGPLSARKA
ncbi:MAG: transglycosylase domain-containing protein, partial [Acidobacteria bacterium]|nr:transglycosylase domain-containing protein [Acidobacteriota bacterium]